jgi:HSP20 family protein
MSDLSVQNRPSAMVDAGPRSSITYTPRFDIWEDDNAYYLAGDLPGVNLEQLDIQFENYELRIWGKVAPRQSGAAYWAQEYGVGDFYRSFTLDEAVDSEGIAAALKDGVLTVTLPKHPSTKPRRIAVKTG